MLKTRRPRQRKRKQKKQRTTRYLPYVKGVSEKIKKTCKAMNATTKVKAVFKPYRMMRQILMKVKNPVPAEKKGVVYIIPCQDCTKVYVGETGRTLKKRMSEHKQAVKRFDEKTTTLPEMKPESQPRRPTGEGSKKPSASLARKEQQT